MNILNLLRRGGDKKNTMAHLFQVTIRPTAEPRTVNIVAETPEEAQAKAGLTEGEVVETINDAGEVVV